MPIPSSMAWDGEFSSTAWPRILISPESGGCMP